MNRRGDALEPTSEGEEEPQVAADQAALAGEELEWLIERARSLFAVVRANERRLDRDAGRDAAKIAALEEDVRQLERQLASAEQQNQRLMSLYVATYQLHATLSPTGVLGAISEIVLGLVGADRFAVLLSNSRGRPPAIVLAHGLDEERADHAHMRFAGRQYGGGDALVDATLADGRLRMGGDSGPIAVVPLNVNGRTVGALVLLRLLGHRREIGPEDREALDLLGAHAACALFAAQSYTSADRKLRTLAGILEPARRTA